MKHYFICLYVFFLHICILIARMIVSSWAACVGGVLLRIWSGLCIIAWIPPCGTVRPMTRTRQYLASQFQSRLEKRTRFIRVKWHMGVVQAGTLWLSFTVAFNLDLILAIVCAPACLILPLLDHHHHWDQHQHLDHDLDHHEHDHRGNH